MIPKDCLKVGLICAAIYQDYWHRAKIVDIVDDSEVTVSSENSPFSFIFDDMDLIYTIHVVGLLCRLWNHSIASELRFAVPA